MNSLPHSFNLDELQIDEIYEYYDQPCLFTSKDRNNQIFLVVLIDETKFSSIWIYAPISLMRLNRLKNKKIDLKRAFSQTEDKFVYKVEIPKRNNKVRVDKVFCQDLTDDQLPMAGEFLQGAKVQNLVQNLKDIIQTKRRNITVRTQIKLAAFSLVTFWTICFLKLGGLQVVIQSFNEKQSPVSDSSNPAAANSNSPTRPIDASINSPFGGKTNSPIQELLFNQGKVIILDQDNQKKVLIRATISYSSNNQERIHLIIKDIPLSQYQSGLIKLNKDTQVNGILLYYNKKNRLENEYKLDTEGTDLRLKLNKSPIKKGEIVEGILSGMVTNGVDKEIIFFRLVLPIV